MRISVAVLLTSTISLFGCIDSNIYEIENGVRLNKKTGEMSLIAGDSYKKIVEYQVSNEETEPKLWEESSIPLINNKGAINIKTKYKGGYILYSAELMIKESEISNSDFVRKNRDGLIIVKFKDKHGFMTGDVINLEIKQATQNYSAAKNVNHVSWESKIPATTESFKSIETLDINWAGFNS